MTTRNILEHPVALGELERIFADAGYEFVFVGGPVRDWMLGIIPKDIDCATSATPAEQVALYEANGISYIPTGLQHGTISVVLDHIVYEITSYRIDAETDGRHAEVVYTRDLPTDLARRDLTINAIAMAFDGTIIDPFGGEADLRAGVVRFVGDANQRLIEDYLRILRYFRFWGRFSAVGKTDVPALEAIRANKEGLAKISVERIWSEVAKIVSGPRGWEVVALMSGLGVLETIGLPDRDIDKLAAAWKVIRDPAVLMGAWLKLKEVEALATRWKWSNDHRQTAKFIASRKDAPYPVALAKREIVEGAHRPNVLAVLTLNGDADGHHEINNWPKPIFPVTGDDLMAVGMKPGPEMGRWMVANRERWIESNYTLSKDEMLSA